jgi:hypothetical protein
MTEVDVEGQLERPASFPSFYAKRCAFTLSSHTRMLLLDQASPAKSNTLPSAHPTFRPPFATVRKDAQG